MSNRIERRTLDASQLQTRAVDDQSPRTIVGYAAVYDQWTTLYQTPNLIVREIIRPGAFRNAISSNQDVRALIDHDSSLLIGRTRAGTLTLAEDGVGLFFQCTPPDTQVARDLMANIRVGNVSQCSFAFLPRDGGQTITTETVGGVTTQSIEVTDVDLYDVSVVTYPAYESTSVSLRVKQLEADVIRELEETRHAREQRSQARAERLSRLTARCAR